MAKLFGKKRKQKRPFVRLKKMVTPAAIAAGVRQSIIATIFTSMITELARVRREKKRRRKK